MIIGLCAGRANFSCIIRIQIITHKTTSGWGKLKYKFLFYLFRQCWLSLYVSFREALIHIQAVMHINNWEAPCEYSFPLLATGQLHWSRWRFDAMLKGILEVVFCGRESCYSFVFSTHIWGLKLSNFYQINLTFLSYVFLKINTQVIHLWKLIYKAHGHIPTVYFGSFTSTLKLISALGYAKSVYMKTNELLRYTLK